MLYGPVSVVKPDGDRLSFFEQISNRLIDFHVCMDGSGDRAGDQVRSQPDEDAAFRVLIRISWMYQNFLEAGYILDADHPAVPQRRLIPHRRVEATGPDWLQFQFVQTGGNARETLDLLRLERVFQREALSLVVELKQADGPRAISEMPKHVHVVLMKLRDHLKLPL